MAAEAALDLTATVYLNTVEQLTRASPAEQLALRQQARSDFRAEPSALNRLRLALMLTSDHQSSPNLLRARELLAELLATAETLPDALVALLRWQDQQLAARLQLHAELASLRQQLAEQKVALIEAEAKLEALTSIEQTIEQTTRESVTPR